MAQHNVTKEAMELVELGMSLVELKGKPGLSIFIDRDNTVWAQNRPTEAMIKRMVEETKAAVAKAASGGDWRSELASAKQIDYIVTLIKSREGFVSGANGGLYGQICKRYGVEDIKDLTKGQASATIELLKEQY